MKTNDLTKDQAMAIKELLYKMADEQLIYGHRNSEWTGIGPTLEEDISFSSIAQDKIGQAFNLYQMLEELGEGDPDELAFNRDEKQFRCSHLVEYPAEGYDFSLIRHFLFDHAEYLRFEMLSNSSYEPLANLAKKFKGEVKYHVFHANTWIKQLGTGSEESHLKLQASLDQAFPLALGGFEPSDHEHILTSENIFEGESVLKEKWLEMIRPIVDEAGLKFPDATQVEPAFGGRKGYHTEHLDPLLKEMTEVFQIDPGAHW